MFYSLHMIISKDTFENLIVLGCYTASYQNAKSLGGGVITSGEPIKKL